MEDLGLRSVCRRQVAGGLNRPLFAAQFRNQAAGVFMPCVAACLLAFL